MTEPDDIYVTRPSITDPMDATQAIDAGGNAAAPDDPAGLEATINTSGPPQPSPVGRVAVGDAKFQSGKTPGISPDETVTIGNTPSGGDVARRPESADAKGDPARGAVVRSGTSTAKEKNLSTSESRYHMIKTHAKGGLGEVFVARDLELGRTVALKEIQTRHSMNRINQDRFVAEAVITGALEHPGIVPIYGLGRYGDGRPYYAMRFISGTSFQAKINAFYGSATEGTKIDFFSREFKSLLRIFVEVCRAIHYAHEHGVLHRDIKPDNVMLGQYGETMVVDWGLAKVLADQPSLKFATNENPVLKSIPTETVVGAVMGTPAYMSPEQAMGNNDNLDARSDIYSLGATLFTLLSGQRSVEGRSSLEVLENVRQGRLKSLEQISPSVPRALASIVAKSMNCKCEDRYPNVGLMVEDIERWLADELVLAHQGFESVGERMGRWVRRHHTWVVAGGMFLAAFLVLAIAAAVLIDRARSRELLARQQAEVAKAEAMQRYRQSREAIDTWLVGSSDALQFFPGTQSIRTRMLALAADDYSRLASSPSRDPDLELERARALIRLGDIHQIQMKVAQAIESYQEAASVLKAIVGSTSIDHLAGAEAAHAETRLGVASTLENRWGDAQEKYQQAIATLSPLADQHPQVNTIDQYLIAALVNSAEASLALGKVTQAIATLESAIKRCDRLTNAENKAANERADVVLAGARSRELLGRAYLTQGEYDNADAVLIKAIDALTQVSRDQADDPRLLDALASASVSRANLQRTRGDQSRMETALRDAAEYYQKLIIAMPDVPTYSENLALTYTDLGIAQLDDERPEEANRTIVESSRLIEELLRVYPDVAGYHEQNAVCDDALSQIVLERDEDGERALALASRAIRTYLELADLFPETVDYRHRLAIARSHAALAIVLIETRKRAESDTADQAKLSSAVDVPDDAKMLFEGAIEGLRTLQSEHPDVPDYRYSLGHILYRYGLLVATAGQPDIARDLFGQSIDLWRPLSEAGHAESADYLALLLATCPVSDLRNPADALSASTLATSASPSNLRYQLTHAVSLALNGDFTASEAAISSIRSARGNLAPRDHWGQAILAKLANTDNFTQHRIQAESALMAHPGCPRMLAFQELLNQLEQKSD